MNVFFLEVKCLSRKNRQKGGQNNYRIDAHWFEEPTPEISSIYLNNGREIHVSHTVPCGLDISNFRIASLLKINIKLIVFLPIYKNYKIININLKR